MYRENELEISLSFFRRKLSETIDQAIDLANAKFNDSARTYFEIAVGYKANILKLEEDLRKIRHDYEESYKRLLNEE